MRKDSEVQEITFLLWAEKGHPSIRKVETIGEVERISPSLVRITCLEETSEKTRLKAEEAEEALVASGLRWAEE